MEYLVSSFLNELKKEISESVIKEIKKVIEEVSEKKRQEKKYLTRKEAAAYLKISLPTLDKVSREGAIRSQRISGSIRYEQSDLESALTERKFSNFVNTKKN